MVDKLTKLYNTMSLIETKGKNTMYMSDCLKFVEQLILEERQKTEKVNNEMEE